MSVSQSNRDSLCSTAESDCSALSAASDSVAVQRHAQALRSATGHVHESQNQSTLRHSLGASVRDLQRDSFFFQPIANANLASDSTGCDNNIPQRPVAVAVGDASAIAGAAAAADAAGAAAAAIGAEHSSTSTPFSGYFSASSSASLPSLVGAASQRQMLLAAASQADGSPHVAAVSNSASASGSAITASSSAELDNVMTASTSSAPVARVDPTGAIGGGSSASADVLLIRPTPIKAAAGTTESASSQSLAAVLQSQSQSQSQTQPLPQSQPQSQPQTQPKAAPAGGAFTHVTTTTATNTTAVYERELISMMQRTALSQLPNNDNHQVVQCGRAIARVRRSRTPSQPTNTSPSRCSSQSNDVQQSHSAGCACARTAQAQGQGQAGLIEFTDGACGACAIAAARAAGRKRRRRRPIENNGSLDCEPGSLSDSSHSHQAESDSLSSDCDDRDEFETSSGSGAKVTDSPARCDSKCRRRFAATAEVRPSINAEKMLTVVSLSDVPVEEAEEFSRLPRYSDTDSATPNVRRRPISQIVERASGSTGVHASFSMMESQFAAVAASELSSAPLFAASSAARFGGEQSESDYDDDELLEAASCALAAVVTPSRFASENTPFRGASFEVEPASAIRELDIEQIENN